MQEFMYLFRGGDTPELEQSPEKMQEHMQQWMKWMDELGRQGKFASGEPLENRGRIVSGTKKVISDGPYTEGKEIVGGYLIIKARDLDEATELSKGCPIFENDGIVEIRPIQKMEM